MSLQVNRLVGFGAKRAVAAAGGFLSFGSWTTSITATIDIPSGAGVGDIAILWDYTTSSSTTIPTDVTPTGFTQIATTSFSGPNSVRASMSRKVLVGGDPGSTLTGMNDARESKILLVLTGTSAITAHAVQSINSETTNGDPASQTITSGSGTPSLVCIGAHGANALPSTAMSPAADGSQTSETVNARSIMEYKIYNSSPSNVTWDPVDAGSRNGAISCYIEVS